MKDLKLSTKIVLVVVGLILVVSPIVYLISQKNNKNQGSKTQNKIATYHGLTPGSSTKDNLIESLGQPLKESTSSDVPVEFGSTSRAKNNQVFIKDNVVSLIKEMVTPKDNKKIENITSLYGSYEYKLYGPYSDSGYNLFVYLKNNLAYLGNENTGGLLEIWYFPKTDNINSFINLYAKDYSLQFKSTQD